MGRIYLNGDTASDTEGKFDHLDNKFDLAVYVDIDLERDPVNAKDIIDVIPRVIRSHLPEQIENNGVAAAGAHCKSRGVPISVTLFPIPTKLQNLARKELTAFRLNYSVAYNILNVFSDLEDINHRFTALIDKMTPHKEFIPKLVEHVLANSFWKHHLDLLAVLRQLIRGIRSGDKERMEAHSDHRALVLAILDQGKTLYAAHTTTADTRKLLPPEFPFIFLEKPFQAFLDFLDQLQRIPTGLTDKNGNDLPPRLNTVDDVRRALRHQLPIPLFILTPSIEDGRGIPMAARFLFLLRNRKTYHRRYLLYLEDCSDEEALPHSDFLNLRESAYFLGKLDANGDWTWTRDGKDTPDTDLLPLEGHSEHKAYLFASSHS
ncbi:hypothetical protein V8B97DRAFT_1920889 [Scleroderma yunnanense]